LDLLVLVLVDLLVLLAMVLHVYNECHLFLP